RDHSIPDQVQHFLHSFTYQGIRPYLIKFGKGFQQVNRTILVFVTDLRGGRKSASVQQWAAVSSHALEIALVYGIMAILFQPMESFLSEMQGGCILGSLIISRQSINGKCISIGSFHFYSALSDVPPTIY